MYKHSLPAKHTHRTIRPPPSAVVLPLTSTYVACGSRPRAHSPGAQNTPLTVWKTWRPRAKRQQRAKPSIRDPLSQKRAKDRSRQRQKGKAGSRRSTQLPASRYRRRKRVGDMLYRWGFSQNVNTTGYTPFEAWGAWTATVGSTKTYKAVSFHTKNMVVPDRPTKTAINSTLKTWTELTIRSNKNLWAGVFTSIIDYSGTHQSCVSQASRTRSPRAVKDTAPHPPAQPCKVLLPPNRNYHLQGPTTTSRSGPDVWCPASCPGCPRGALTEHPC